MKKTNVRKHTRKIPHGRTKVKKHKRSVYVPPAWKKVKKFSTGPILATGIDAKGRKQTLYSEEFRAKEDKAKFKRLDKLEKEAPKIISSVLKDADKNKQEAQAVYLMYKTGFRPGTEKDTMADKKAYGAITLRTKHVMLEPNDKVKFDFTGKKGVQIEKEVKDKKLSNIMKERKSGAKLFDTNATNVRRYFQKKTGDKYQLKDLRGLKGHQVAKKTKGDKKKVAEAVSAELGNTPKVAVQSYIQPTLIK